MVNVTGKDIQSVSVGAGKIAILLEWSVCTSLERSAIRTNRKKMRKLVIRMSSGHFSQSKGILWYSQGRILAMF